MRGSEGGQQSRTVFVEYFALFQELRGLDREEVETAARTAGDLYRELASRFSLPYAPDAVGVAINDEFAGWSAELQPGDRIVLLAPMSGG